MPKEYIEREAALRGVNEFYHEPKIDIVLRQIPAEDVVEVVRCGECVHSKKRNKEEDTVMCLKYMAYKGVKGFCNEGEKK